MQLFSGEKTTLKSSLIILKYIFPYCPELPKQPKKPKQKNSCSKMWLTYQLYIKLLLKAVQDKKVVHYFE